MIHGQLIDCLIEKFGSSLSATTSTRVSIKDIKTATGEDQIEEDLMILTYDIITKSLSVLDFVKKFLQGVVRGRDPHLS